MDSKLKINIISLLNNYETVLENDLKKEKEEGGIMRDVIENRLKDIEANRKNIMRL